MRKKPQHTAEPWQVGLCTVDKYGDRFLCVAPATVENGETSDMICLITSTKTLTEQDDANAERIVECVNACAGIEDPQKFRDTWEAIKHLELDSYYRMKSKHDLLQIERDGLKKIVAEDIDAMAKLQAEARNTADLLERLADYMQARAVSTDDPTAPNAEMKFLDEIQSIVKKKQI